MTDAIHCQFQIIRGDFRRDFDLNLPIDGVTVIFGPSGSGKTSLLRAIAGLDRYNSAFLKIGERVLQDRNVFVPVHQRGIGYVFQEAALFTHLTVSANLEYAAQFANAENQAASNGVQDLSTMFGIEHLLNRRVQALSGGERQRVALARCLAASPKVLLLDEPLASLDENARQEIMPYIDLLANSVKIPILYVSHSKSEVARLANYVVLLDKQAKIVTGETNQVLTRLDLPLAQHDDASAIIETKLVSHDEQYGLSYLCFGSGQIAVLKKELRIGQLVRVRVLASDVSIAINTSTDSSILNIFSVTVVEIKSQNAAQSLLQLSTGTQIILSRITNKSLQALRVKVGDRVFAQIKSVAVLV